MRVIRLIISRQTKSPGKSRGLFNNEDSIYTVRSFKKPLKYSRIFASFGEMTLWQ